MQLFFPRQRRCSNLSLKSWNRPAQREASEAELASEQSQRSPLESCKIEEEAGNKPATKTRTRRKPKRMLPPPKPVQRYRPKLDKYKRLLRQKEKAGGKVKTPRSRLAKKKPARKPPVAKCKTETPFGGEAEELRSAKEGGSSAGCVPADQETASLGSWENSNGSSSTATSSLGGSNSAAAKEARLQAKVYCLLDLFCGRCDTHHAVASYDCVLKASKFILPFWRRGAELAEINFGFVT